MRGAILLIFILVLFTLFPLVLQAQQVKAPTFTLTEYLGESWSQELVSFPVEVPAALNPQRLAVREAAGAVRPAQFLPDAANSRSGRLYFLVDLPAKGKQSWQLIEDRTNWKTTDYNSTSRQDYVEFGNDRIAVRCPTGEHQWPGGIAAAQIPAPMLAVRLSNRVWAGAGKLNSPLKVTAFKSEFISRGFAFTRYRMTYTFEGNLTYTAEIQAIAGQEVILVSERSNLNEKVQFLEGIRPADAPQGNFTMNSFGKRLYEQGSYWTLSLEEGLAPDRIAWQPLHNVWGKSTAPGEPWGTFVRAKDPGPLVSLNPSHGEWWANVSQWAGAYSTAGNAFIGLMALNAGAWQNHSENTIALENDPQGRLRAVLPINSGSRTWGLCAYGKDEAIRIPGEEPRGDEYPGRQYARPPQLATIKYGLLPLDLVKDWALDFPDPEGTVFPHIYAKASDLDAIRKRIAATPTMKKNTDQLKSVWDNIRRKNDPNYPIFPKRFIYPKGVDNIYLATGDESYARDLAALLLDRLHYYIHQTRTGVGLTGYRWGHSYGMFHLTTGPLSMSSREADIALGSPSVTPGQKRDIRALLAFWGELFSSRDYAPPGYNHGNTDMFASLYTILGSIGCVLNGHPKAKDWAQASINAVDHALKNQDQLPGASQDELYGSLTLEMITQAAMCLKRAEFADLFKDQRYRDSLDFYGKLLVPVDPRHGFGYIVPFGNGMGSWIKSVMWGVAAAGVVKDDPEFAGRLMWYWERSGRPGNSRTEGHDEFGWMSLGWLDPTIPAKNPQLASEPIPGWGVIFRNGCGTPQETYMALQIAKPNGLHGYNAEGGFHLIAQGAPLSLIFGLRSYDAGIHGGQPNMVEQRWLANRPSFDYRSEEEGGTGKLVEWAGTSTADLASGEWSFSRLLAHAPLGPAEGENRLILSQPRPQVPGLTPGHTQEERVKPITWRRHVLFVKDDDPAGLNYFFIRDAAQTTVPWDWSVWCLAEGFDLEAPVGHFTGKFGVDLDVMPVTPIDDLITGSYGPVTSFSGFWRQKLYQVPLKPEQKDIAVVLFPRRHAQAPPEITPWANGCGAKIALPGETHYLFLTDKSTEFQMNDITITGRAAVLRRKGTLVTLSLLSGMQLAAGDYLLAAATADVKPAGPITLIVDTKAKTARGESHGAARNVILRLPASIKPTALQVDGKPAQMTQSGGQIKFSLPEGDHTFSLK
ncbi:MAG: hypothetical protein ACYC7E_04405 [Armatimonadota bacterium]